MRWIRAWLCRLLGCPQERIAIHPPASVTAPLGQPGPFSASVAFTPNTPGSPGFIQVLDTSPATGAVTHLASVLIRFQGA